MAGLKAPSVNQLLTFFMLLAIAAIIVKALPANVQTYFRI